MFYKALGYSVWKLGVRYVRKNYGPQLKAGAGAALFLAVLGAGYLFTRSDDDE